MFWKNPSLKICTAKLITTLLAVTATGVIVVACSNSEPKNVLVDLSIREGTLDRDNSVIEIKHNDTVTFRITADEHGSVHLHGYDLKINVGPDETGTLEFTANATGKYPFTLHTRAIQEESEETTEENGDMEGHGVLFESPTLETEQSFSFTIPTDQMESTLLFHNHMNHEMKGEIKVSISAQEATSTQFEIREDGSFEPYNVSVRPGTIVVWINKGSKRARPTSGKAPMVEENDHGHDEDGSPEDEITLGTLEVHPR